MSMVAVSVVIIIFAVIIGVLNYSPDGSIIYRKGIEFAFSESFKKGCFCLNNKLDGSLLEFGNECANGCTAEIIVLDNKVYKDLVLGGDVGLGEAYVNEYWTYDSEKYDLGDLLTEFILGMAPGDSTIVDYVLSYLIIERWNQWYERKYNIQKTLEEDQSSVQHHYDLGDDVYSSFLGETMMYTCAIWDKQSHQNNDLKAAQINKINILADKMGLHKNDKVLDLGTGWGYVPYHINKVIKAKTVGITMSKNQYDHNVKKFKSAKNVEYKYTDYRDHKELSKHKFNKIISVGMMEHVGIKNLDIFWDSVTKILDSSKDNVVGLHYFTMGDITPGKFPIHRSKACEQQTFIFKHIFPGACLLYPDWVNERALKYEFNLLHQETYGFHYAKTLQVWRDDWVTNGKKVIKNNPKYEDDLFKMFEYYLAVSEAMFRTGHVTLVHQIFVKQNKGNKKQARNIDIGYIFDNFTIPHSE